MEEDDYTPATRPDHWRLDVLEDQVDRLYYQGGAFFVAEVERCSKGRIWQPEEDLDISPDPEEQMERKDGLWLFSSPDLMCDSLVRLERSYMRGGLSRTERIDLDRRYDRLSAQVRSERRDHDNRRH